MADTKMTTASVDVSDLERDFAGTILTTKDPGYDQARVLFNRMIDRRPAVIAQCASVQDVAAAIGFARARGLEIAVRGGGHSVAGMSLVDDGLVIDLRLMTAAAVDADARTVTIGGGALMRDLDRATEPFGLATTGGRVSTTGLGGLLLGGGNGWLDRKFGLACDNLLAVELVTADGQVVRASDREHPDLFWALHGGGGNFGVATSLTLRLHPLATVSARMLMWDPRNGPEIIRCYRDFLESAPDDIGGAIKFHTAPDAYWVPAALRGRLACTSLVIFTGTGDPTVAMAPMLGLGHVGERRFDVSYADLQSMLDDPPGYRNHWSAEYLASLPDAAIDAFCARAQDMIVPSPSEQVLVPMGGAAGRGPREYPLPWRRSAWVVFPFGMWADPVDDGRARQWTRDLRADVRPWSSGATYLNFIGDEGRDRVLAGFGRKAYARLARIKAEYDPDNLFHRNHNIEPA